MGLAVGVAVGAKVGAAVGGTIVTALTTILCREGWGRLLINRVKVSLALGSVLTSSSTFAATSNAVNAMAYIMVNVSGVGADVIGDEVGTAVTLVAFALLRVGADVDAFAFRLRRNVGVTFSHSTEISFAAFTVTLNSLRYTLREILI